MEILLQDCTGARIPPNCTATFIFDYKTVRGHTHTRTLPKTLRRLFFFYYKTIRGPHTTRLHGGGRRGNHPNGGCFFLPRRKPIILNIIIIHLLHPYIHCDLDHSFSKLYKSQIFIFLPQGGKFSLAAGKCSLLTFDNTTNFQISRRRGGIHVTWEVEGDLLFLKKSLPPLGQTRHPYF